MQPSPCRKLRDLQMRRIILAYAMRTDRELQRTAIMRSAFTAMQRRLEMKKLNKPLHALGGSE